MLRYIDSTRISGRDAARKLNPHLLSLVEIPDELPLVTVDPKTLLLNPRRFDLLAKYIYAKHRHLGIQSNWAARLYDEHVRIFNDFAEGDLSGKVGKEAFFDSFHDILTSIESRGFLARESLVPVSSSGTVIDGAHRVAACAVYGHPVSCVVLDCDPRYDHGFFARRGLGEKFCDAIALEYCLLNEDAYVVIVYPSAVGKDEEVETILEASGRVFYRKEIEFSRLGSVNLIRQIYSQEDWLGSWENQFAGARKKASDCFRHKNPARIFAYEIKSAEGARLVKEEIRALFRISNHSIHINDRLEEKRNLATLFFNDNSVHFLNNARQNNYPNFFSLFKEYRDWLHRNAVDRDSFCVDGSAVMAAYGLREAADLDFLHFGHDDINTVAPMVTSHNTEAHHHTIPREDIVFDPENHFYYEGVKFAALDVVRSMKGNRGEGKDHYDVALIGSFLDQRSARVYYLRGRRRLRELLRNIRSSRLMYPARFAKRILRTGLAWGVSVIDRLRPFERTMMYRGFSVRYSKGTSIVERVKREGVYEEEKANRIIRALKGRAKPVMMDVGANIGLVSLDVLAGVPNTRIYAFEPGPHQCRLFRTTIRTNALEQRIDLFQFALGDTKGTTKFAIHDTKDASGDGFFDTGRAGATEAIDVEVRTIDDWWTDAGCLDVDVLKIDTEGAELMVLRGGESMIERCQPLLFLEINTTNLKPYPYDAPDILDWLRNHAYVLETLEGSTVTSSNLMEFLGKTEDFVARPLKE